MHAVKLESRGNFPKKGTSKLFAMPSGPAPDAGNTFVADRSRVGAKSRCREREYAE